MSPVTVSKSPPRPDTETPLIISLDLRPSKPEGRWLKVLLAGLVVFALALAAGAAQANGLGALRALGAR